MEIQSIWSTDTPSHLAPHHTAVLHLACILERLNSCTLTEKMIVAYENVKSTYHENRRDVRSDIENLDFPAGTAFYNLTFVILRFERFIFSTSYRSGLEWIDLDGRIARLCNQCTAALEIEGQPPGILRLLTQNGNIL